MCFEFPKHGSPKSPKRLTLETKCLKFRVKIITHLMLICTFIANILRACEISEAYNFIWEDIVSFIILFKYDIK